MNTTEAHELQTTATARTTEAVAVLDFINAMVISTDAERHGALKMAAQIKTSVKAAKAEMTKATTPMRESLEVVRGWFRPATQSLEAAEKVIKNKVMAYDRVQELAKNQALLEAAEAGRKARELETAAAQTQDPTQRAGLMAQAGAHQGDAGALIVQADTHEAAKTSGAVTTRTMVVEVTDLNAAVNWCVANSMNMLLTLNTTALKALAKSGNPPRIPGVQWVETSNMSITAAKVLG